MNRTWTKTDDKRLLSGVKAGKSLSRLGIEIKGSRSAGIARFSRINGIVFASDAARTAARAKRKHKHQELLHGIIQLLRATYTSRQQPRTELIREAVAAGFRRSHIASAFGVSRQYVYIIAPCIEADAMKEAVE